MRHIKHIFFTAITALTLLAFPSCHKQVKREPVLRESFKHLTDPGLELDEGRIRKAIADIMYADHSIQYADIRAKEYYVGGNRFLWISRHGIDEAADSVLKYVSEVSRMGFSPSRFRLPQIRKDITDARRLSPGADINRQYARLEYNLTKAYFLFCSGQRFGYVNPRKILNRLDVRDSDSVRVAYRELFDLPIKQAGKHFFADAAARVRQGRAGSLLRESTPHDKLYYKLLEMLASARSEAIRNRIMCNMERCRWATSDTPDKHTKFVMLNIPSQELDAVDDGTTTRMRVVCGSKETKTPLLQSYIERMDVNPQWIIPKSIVKKSVAPNAGNPSYFSNRGYFVMERSTGKHVDPALTTPGMLMSKDYLVIQRGGKGNAMGRIVFRFNNKFSVFLHDTSNPKLFNSADRMASHGCVRVERPFDLAVFLLGNKDEKLIDKINYSINADLSCVDNGDEDAEKPRPDKSMLVKSVRVDPKVPLFITYFTLFPSQSGNVVAYPDIYGYDKVIIESLKNLM